MDSNHSRLKRAHLYAGMEKLKKVSCTLSLFKYPVDPQIPFIMPPLVPHSSAERVFNQLYQRKRHSSTFILIVWQTI